MGGMIRPNGPDGPFPGSAQNQDMIDAITALQKPGRPQRMASVALKADLPPAASFKECAVICDEINSLVVSTLVSGSYAWKRADGSAL